MGGVGSGVGGKNGTKDFGKKHGYKKDVYPNLSHDHPNHRVKGKGPNVRHKFMKQAHEIAKKEGVNPIEILCRIIKQDHKFFGYHENIYRVEAEKSKRLYKRRVIPMDMVRDAAKELCKYLYPQLKAIAVEANMNSEVKVESIEDHIKRTQEQKENLIAKIIEAEIIEDEK